jgi:hypothetical protein
MSGFSSDAAFPSDAWFGRLAAAAYDDPETFARLGFAELRLAVEVVGDERARRFGIVLDGYDVDYAGELTDDLEFAPEATVTGPIDAWLEMVENIDAHGGADNEHTLNRLTMAGVPLSVEAVDPMGRDKFYRYAETLQTLFDGTARRSARV